MPKESATKNEVEKLLKKQKEQSHNKIKLKKSDMKDNADVKTAPIPQGFFGGVLGRVVVVVVSFNFFFFS